MITIIFKVVIFGFSFLLDTGSRGGDFKPGGGSPGHLSLSTVHSNQHILMGKDPQT